MSSIVNGMQPGSGQADYGEGVWLPDENRAVIASSIDILNTKGNVIGYLQSVAPSQSMTRTVIRHLSATDAGRPIEIVPGLPEYKLSITGFHLYPDGDNAEQADLASRLIFGSDSPSTLSSLAQIQDYFDIGIRFSHPNPGGSAKTGIYTFYKCAIDSWDMGTFNIEGGMTVSQSCQITSLGVEYETLSDTYAPSTL